MKNLFKAFFVVALLGMFAACDPKEEDPINPGTPDNPTRPAAAVQVNVDAITPETFTVTFHKVDSCINYHILACEPSSQEMFFPMFGFTGWDQATAAWGILCTGDTTYTWDEMIPNTEYVIFVLAHFANSDTLITDTVFTATLGGHGTSSVSVEVSNVAATSVTTTATPNQETAMFKDFVISKDYYEEIGHDSTVNLLKSDYYSHYSVDTWNWLDLTPNTQYYFAAIGQNADGQWGEMSMVPFTTLQSK